MLFSSIQVFLIGLFSIIGCVQSKNIIDDLTLSINNEKYSIPTINEIIISSDSSIKINSKALGLSISNDKYYHQVELIIKDTLSGLEQGFLGSIKQNGEIALSIDDVSKISKSLLVKEGPLEFIIVLGSFNDDFESIIKTIASNVIVDSKFKESILKGYQEPLRYGPKLEINHIFRSAEKTVPVIVSLTFSTLLIAVLFGLIVAWLGTGAISKFSNKPHWSINSIIFLTIIGFIEFTFVKYYLGDSIFITLARSSFLGTFAVYFGSRTLREARVRRVEK